MIKLVYRHFQQHLSLLAIIAGAVGFFVSNIFMKEIFSPTVYGHYSIVVTYFSLIYVFGIFGTEQVFLRFSRRIKKDTIETQKAQLTLVSFITLFSSIISTFLFKEYYSEIRINSLLLFFSSVSMIGMLFMFTILRLNTNFVFSQLISNYWKIILFILSIMFFILKKNDLDIFLNIVCFNIILIFVVSVLYIKKSIRIFYNQDISNRELILTAFHFFLSILSFSLIIFADRFIIEMKYSFADFGNFFYLINFFLSPFAILQNYIGFKQLIVFKNKFDKEYFFKSNKTAVLLGMVLGLFLLSMAFFLNFIKVVNFKFDNYISIILILLLTGIIRLYSSSIIAAFEARTSIKTLRKSNVFIVTITLFILLLAYLFANSIELILIGIIILWLFRCLIHRQLLLQQMKNNN